MRQLIAFLCLLSAPALAQVDITSMTVSPAGLVEITAVMTSGNYENTFMKGGGVTLEVTVSGCTTAFTTSLGNYGVVTPVYNNGGNKIIQYDWYLEVDMSACQCTSTTVKKYHCDGCGRVFTTCSGEGEICPPSETVTVVAGATNKNGNSMCTTLDYDLDGQYDDCDGWTAELLSAGGATTEYVPEKFWDGDPNDHSSMVCLSRAESGPGNSCKPIASQGGDSCGD